MTPEPSNPGRRRFKGRTFVIYAGPRTGSNRLVSLLNSHPDVLCHYELFNRSEIFSGFAEKSLESAAAVDMHDTRERDRDPMGFLDRLYELGEGFECQGFKLLPHQNERVQRACVRNEAAASLVLKRRDLLKTFLSGCIARRTGEWAAHDAPRPGIADADRRIRFNSHDFRRFLLRLSAYYSGIEAALCAAGKDYRVIYYEDLDESVDEAMVQIGKSLRVRPSGFDPAQCGFSRQNHGSAFEMVTNPEEMARFLDRTDLAGLFSGTSRIHAAWLAALGRLSR